MAFTTFAHESTTRAYYREGDGIDQLFLKFGDTTITISEVEEAQKLIDDLKSAVLSMVAYRNRRAATDREGL